MKQPKPPDRPLVPYMRFSKKMWAKVRTENPERQLWDIGKVIGQMWREAADSEKSVYQEEYDQEKIEYDKALKAYHNSAAYQAFLASKKAKGPDKPPMTATASISGGGNRPPMRVVSAGVEIQPVDEDENTGDAYFSQRLLADVRFKRNHRLIADLFSTNIVADTRSVVSQPRIDSLKRQAHSLTEHQNKLENELKKLEEGFQLKKRAIEESGVRFSEQLKKVCEEKPQLDEIKYKQMVDDVMVRLADAYEEYKLRQESLRQRQQAEREQIAGSTPILYRLTANDAPSPSLSEQQKPNENGLPNGCAAVVATGDASEITTTSEIIDANDREEHSESDQPDDSENET